MPDFTRVIQLAYQRILGRPPDAGGLDSYNRAMNNGLTEAEMRESLLRSAEYAQKNPSFRAAQTSVSTTSASAKKRTALESKPKRAARKKPSTRRAR